MFYTLGSIHWRSNAPPIVVAGKGETMANQEQLAILRSGTWNWSLWRRENPNAVIDLSGANLRAATLMGANLIAANLGGADLVDTRLTRADLTGADLRMATLARAYLDNANLRGANLSKAVLEGAHLEQAKLYGVDLSEADLSQVNLGSADMTEANLSQAMLQDADLSYASLKGASLTDASLADTIFNGTDLSGTDFSQAELQDTIFGDLDLSEAIGLGEVIHDGPSRISTDVLARSKGKIPNVFLQGCGLSDWEIEEAKLYNPNLSNDEVNEILYKMYELRATQALQISPLFLSYSHTDSEFVDRIGDCLTQKGIRYWRDIHDMKAGRMEKQIDRAIRQNPTVLLVLSKHSLKSDWVEHEVRKARALGKELEREVLCPVALDDSWKDSHWPQRVMEQIMEYNILDFSAWHNESRFDEMFRKLIDGLELFYNG